MTARTSNSTTIGRSAQIGQSRSAWSRTDRRTCAGGTSEPQGPAARNSSFNFAKRAATSLDSSLTAPECKERGLRPCKRLPARAPRPVGSRRGRDLAAHARPGRARRQRDLRARAAARRSPGRRRTTTACCCRRSRRTRARGCRPRSRPSTGAARTIPQRLVAMALAAARPGPLRARLAGADVVHYPADDRAADGAAAERRHAARPAAPRPAGAVPARGARVSRASRGTARCAAPTA